MMNGTAPTPAPPPPSGTMGPPSRPAEKATDAAELTDVLASSGIDVREEEAFLTSSYSGPGVQPPRAQQVPPPQQQQQQQQLQQAPTSFTSQTSTTGTPTPTASFSEPSQIKTQDSYYTEPTPAPYITQNEPIREDSEAARRAQYHLQEPFLLTKLLEQKLQRRGFELGVRIPAEGLFHPVPGRPQPIEVTGPDGSSIVRTGKTILNQEGAPLVDILNLMSICCEERLRNVVDYSSSLARSRRAHSHGAVPVEWQDLARSAEQANGTGSPKPSSLKRMAIQRDRVYRLLLTCSLGPHSATDQSSSTRSLPEKYRMLMEKDVSNEEIRAKKRAKRSENAILGESTGNRAESTEPTGSTPSTPIGEKAAGFDKKGMTKKEARKMVDAKASEAQQHQQSVETARMATNSMLSGRVFGTKKSYSWLNRGGTNASGFSTPSRLNAASPSTGGEKTGRNGEPAVIPPKQLGTWREDQERGAGIQLRDVLFMLELDGRGAKHVQKAYSKDLKEDRMD